MKTKKTELLFVALFLKLLKPGGRAAVIGPDFFFPDDDVAVIVDTLHEIKQHAIPTVAA